MPLPSRSLTGPSVPRDGIRDELDVRAGGDDAGNRRRGHVLLEAEVPASPPRPRPPRPPCAFAMMDTAATMTRRREDLQIADPWSHPDLRFDWRPAARGFEPMLTLLATGLRSEKRRDRLDLVWHDLRAAADHEVDKNLPLLPGLPVDLEHPAQRRVTVVQTCATTTLPFSTCGSSLALGRRGRQASTSPARSRAERPGGQPLSLFFRISAIECL